MTTLVTRATKGSELTHGEMDAQITRDVDVKTATYSALVSDNRTTLECNHATVAFTVTLGDAATMAAADTGDYEVTIANIGAALITVARAGSDTIDGVATSIVLAQYSSVTLKVNAANDGYNSIARVIPELDILDGVTSTTAELNILDGATLTVAEINALDADQAATTPTVAGGDSFVMDDADVGTVKVDIDNVDTYLAQTTKTLTNKSIDSNQLTGSGHRIQTVNVQDGTVATGTDVLPQDLSIPQNDEGDEYMTLAITPTSATNKLKIEIVFIGATTAGDLSVALFQDSTAGALSSSGISSGNANVLRPIAFSHYMTAGTTSATTFKVRAGGGSSNTTTFNGISGAVIFGGVSASSITITEIAA